jgi:hypothetical protein
MRLNKQSLHPLSNCILSKIKIFLYLDEHLLHKGHDTVPTIYIASLHITAYNSSMALQKTQQQFEADTTQ